MFSPALVDQNLSLLQELLSCGSNVYLWTFDADGKLIRSNCSDLVLNTIFEKIGCNAQMLSYGQIHTAPLVLGAPLGLMWCIAFERQNSELYRTHMIGPVFNTEVSQRAIDEEFSRYDLNLSFKIQIYNALPKLPVLSTVLLFQYGLMLHYCVTGEKLATSDIQMQQSSHSDAPNQHPFQKRDRHKVYENERALLRMVREGDLNYRSILNRASQLSPGVRAYNGQPLTQAMVSCTTFLSLVTRASIEGGLSPEVAYTVGDSYIQSVMNAKTVAEMGNITNAAYDDFIRRVHNGRHNPRVSPQIQSCCDYIELNLEEPLPLPQLAERVGYTEYHLCRKFKQEVGVNIHEFIRYARVERAKTMLNATDLTIAKIAEHLQFCSPSHFSHVFQQVTGMTPRQWRASGKE